MEAYITPPHRDEFADPLTRLLAAILAFLRALLADHQAAPRPAASMRRAISRKICEPHPLPRRKIDQSPTTPSTAPRHPSHARDMSACLKRPRLVAPS